MSTTTELIQEVESLGVRLLFDGSDRVLTPAGKLSPDLKARLREHKAELFGSLSAKRNSSIP